jgi:hypothetical protein
MTYVEPMTEPEEIIDEFVRLLRSPTGDGQRKRHAGTKPLWKIDTSHTGAAGRHVGRWAMGEEVDADSGAHPLVHAAWRFLAVAWQEVNGSPIADRAEFVRELDRATRFEFHPEPESGDGERLEGDWWDVYGKALP